MPKDTQSLLQIKIFPGPSCGLAIGLASICGFCLRSLCTSLLSNLQRSVQIQGAGHMFCSFVNIALLKTVQPSLTRHSCMMEEAETSLQMRFHILANVSNEATSSVAARPTHEA